MERTIVFYHGSCPDGFGGAYAAWKKFGEAAEYIPLYRDAVPEVEVAGAHLYFIDFTYEKEIMDRFVEAAGSVTVLDHHEGVREIVETMPEHRFTNDQSGATIAWNYFHPDTPTPLLLQYVEDDDLFLYALTDTRAVLCYLTIQPYTFEEWDRIVTELENETTRESVLSRARIYAEYFEHLANLAVEKAHLVEFEGYTCYFGTAHPLKPLKSLVGNLLARKQGPIALVVSAHPKGYGVSIRGDGSVDVAAIAAKYGGNGHKSSAGFAIPAGVPVPWTFVEKDEAASD
ncbi:MAG: hypothetical protein AAB582_01770 [Patescibacteria group bacterium]